MEGLLLINKPINKTSRDVVNELNHIFKYKKIGHTGTLDPIATGVLVCCLGKYTKLVNEITAYDKEYIAEIKLGVKTDTGDITGNIIETKNYNIKESDIKKIFLECLGKQTQTVPKYSAVKINGKKLYEYARNNIEIELPKREIEIFSIEFLEYNGETIKFKTRVSKGTYIRSLIEDICDKLNTVGTMASLERTKQGNFSIEECSTLEEIKNNNYKLLTVDDIFDYPKIEMDNELYKKISNGAKIIDTFNIKNKVMFYYENKCIAIYQKENDCLKSYIQL